jgi:BMFP domain-containing protein YqiC
MTQTTGRFFDELGKLITDAAGAAQGVRKEIESVVRAQAENILRELDVVQREEFEAVKAMAQKAREENEQLKQSQSRRPTARSAAEARSNAAIDCCG